MKILIILMTCVIMTHAQLFNFNLTQEIVSICPRNQIFDVNLRRCVCPSIDCFYPGRWNPSSCTCDCPWYSCRICPKNQFFDPLTCRCKCKEQCKDCTEPQVWNEDICNCVCPKPKKCAKNRFWSEWDCSCLCKQKPRSCCEKKIWSDKVCGCVCKTSVSCSFGYEWDSITCQCIKQYFWQRIVQEEPATPSEDELVKEKLNEYIKAINSQLLASPLNSCYKDLKYQIEQVLSIDAFDCQASLKMHQMLEFTHIHYIECSMTKATSSTLITQPLTTSASSSTTSTKQVTTTDITTTVVPNATTTELTTATTIAVTTDPYDPIRAQLQQQIQNLNNFVHLVNGLIGLIDPPNQGLADCYAGLIDVASSTYTTIELALDTLLIQTVQEAQATANGFEDLVLSSTDTALIEICIDSNPLVLTTTPATTTLEDLSASIASLESSRTSLTQFITNLDALTVHDPSCLQSIKDDANNIMSILNGILLDTSTSTNGELQGYLDLATVSLADLYTQLQTCQSLTTSYQTTTAAPAMGDTIWFGFQETIDGVDSLFMTIDLKLMNDPTDACVLAIQTRLNNLRTNVLQRQSNYLNSVITPAQAQALVSQYTTELSTIALDLDLCP